MPIGLSPLGSLYNPVPDEHLAWGVDTPHNLYPMMLHATQKADGVIRPQRLVNKSQWRGNPLNIFKAFARPQGSNPQTQ